MASYLLAFVDKPQQRFPSSLHRPAPPRPLHEPSLASSVYRLLEPLDPPANMAPGTRNNPALEAKIAALRLQLHPLVSVVSGEPHPAFPGTMLQLMLLTERQLDSLAHFYSQSTPDAFTMAYPQPMRWDKRFLAVPRSPAPRRANAMARLSPAQRLAVKRRLFAKFIGMRGTDTPLWEVHAYVRVLDDHIRHSVQEEERRTMRKWV